MISHLFTHRLLHLCAALLLVGLLATTPAATPTTRAAVQAPSGSAIPCDQTPFGHVLRLNQKNEVFLGINSADAVDPGHLYAYRLGVDATDRLAEQYISDPTTEPTHISALAGTTADLDNDGKDEFIQGFTDANGKYQVLVRKNGSVPQLHTENWLGDSNRAMAAGDILGLDNGSQQVVIASRDGNGLLSVAVFSGAPNGGVGSPLALWRSSTNNRTQASQIRVAVGNLNNNRTADIVVSLLESDQRTEQLIFLEYRPGYQTQSGLDVAQNLQERATGTILIGGVGIITKDVKIVLASLSGSPQQSVVLAYNHQDPSTLSSALLVRNYGLVTVNGTM
jgi:hypothetical protein